MAEETLVEKKLEDAKNLIRELRAKNFDVSAAFWMQIDDGFWHLYLVSKAADEVGTSEAYDMLFPLLRQLGESSIEPSEVRVIGTNQPVAKEVLDLQRQFRLNLYSRQRLRKVGGLRVGEAHIYPPVAVP
jgi:hypothetical protein